MTARRIFRSRGRRRLSWGALLVLGALLAVLEYRGAGLLPRRPGSRGETHASAARAVDGDTIELAGGERVRLLAVDAPERDTPFHQEARELCARLVEGRELRIEEAPGRARDAYGRRLALVRAGGVLVNEELVARGLARVYFKEDGEVAGEVARGLVEAQNAAIDGRRGIWSRAGAIETRPGERLVETRFRFHRPRCAALGKAAASTAPTTREAALRQGKSPCRSCNPRQGRRRACIRPRAGRRCTVP